MVTSIQNTETTLHYAKRISRARKVKPASCCMWCFDKMVLKHYVLEERYVNCFVLNLLMA